ncbi:MAG: chemotaxis protein CheW [Gammaproteobacteria bacterium]|nr:chemotaxis protein CheW [Gammaproteobacteria bacterium]
MTVDISQFYQTFFEESFEGLDVMEASLLNLDVGDTDAETVNTIFRAAHSIKGGSATFGFTNVSDFTHVMETLLDEMRSGQRQATQDSVNTLLESVDVLREMLTAVRDSTDVDLDHVAATKGKLDALLHGHAVSSAPTKSEPPIVAQAATTSAVNSNASPESEGYRIRFMPHEHLMSTGNDPVRMFRELETLGEVKSIALLDKLPPFSEMQATSTYLGWELHLIGNVTQKQIEEVFEWVEGDCDLEISPLGAESAGVSDDDEPSLDVLSLLAPQAEAFPKRFYEQLFSEYPGVKPLFAKTDMAQQQLKLWQVVKTLGEHLDNPEALRPALIDMGKRHQKYGAKTEHYVAVANVMMDNLAHFLGEHFTDAVKNTWQQGLNFAAEVMLGAYEQVAPAPTPAASTSSTPPKPASAPVVEQSKATVAKKAPVSSGEATSIRVSIDKVDALINMVGELVITQSMLGQLGDDINVDNVEKLKDGLVQLERNTRELQESVMRIRMLPISFAFQRFPRMVRDLSQKLNKHVELILLGEQTELDKTVMEKIGDPLVHLVRNSVDHGVETPDIRKANGKPETGTVTLNAYHQGGNIVIEINDDGAGINKERVLAKARERGLIAQEETPSDERIYDMIFHPGFSTAEIVSDVSGRGVGMDVVKKNIRALGGTIEVKSTPGLGSTFTIRLPLTLAILDGQLVRVGENTYIVPLVSIIESVQVKQERINAIAGKAELYKLRDEYIPIVRLYEVFDVDPDSTKLSNGLLVVLEGDGQRVALYVDDLLGQQQVVIKSLETNFRRIEGVSGATILGDGTVALILDISGLIKLSKEYEGGDGSPDGRRRIREENSTSVPVDTKAEVSTDSDSGDAIDENDAEAEKAA